MISGDGYSEGRNSRSESGGARTLPSGTVLPFRGMDAAEIPVLSGQAGIQQDGGTAALRFLIRSGYRCTSDTVCTPVSGASVPDRKIHRIRAPLPILQPRN